jgi:ABC-2 type transport system ATP-binding protein
MSLQVQHLTKYYGQQKAVNDISFTINKGEIVGFLGPNGAGKSTTMKIASGYLPPSSGTVLVDDLDVLDHSLQARKITGYLPEHNPLYLDMYVHEYLHFVGRVYHIELSRLKSRIPEIVEMCGLTREQNKKIE